MATNEAWLATTVEDALEPELPICDPHHHLWDQRSEYVEPRYLLDEILSDIRGGHNIVSTVFIECGEMFKADGPEAMRVLGETEFANGIAAMSASGRYGKPRIAAGIVGTVDLKIGDASAEVLDSHIETGRGRFKGIRLGATWHESPDVPNHRTSPPEAMYDREDFRAGFKHLAPRQLSFEAWCYHTQLAELYRLACDFPDTTIVLDHFGGPIGVGPYANKSDEVFAAWKAAIEPVSQCQNVFAKLGGLVMPVNGFGFEHQAKAPDSESLLKATQRYYEHTIELFGPNRCMFESNFPVDKVSCSYTVLWNSFKRLTQSYSTTERALLFHDTASRVYRL